MSSFRLFHWHERVRLITVSPANCSVHPIPPSILSLGEFQVWEGLSFLQARKLTLSLNRGIFLSINDWAGPVLGLQSRTRFVSVSLWIRPGMTSPEPPPALLSCLTHPSTAPHPKTSANRGALKLEKASHSAFATDQSSHKLWTAPWGCDPG